jgi:hypothetical protein
MKYFTTFIAILIFATSSFAAEIGTGEVNTFMAEWFEAQNTGSYSKYAAMYSNNFVGIRRSGTRTRKFNHDAWLKDRKQMFQKKMIVSGGVLEIKPSVTTASVKFEQKWESGTYTDKGDKLIVLALENGKLKIIREEMLFSKVISTIDVEDSEVSTVTTGATPDGAGKYTSVKQKDCWEPKGYFGKQFDFPEHTQECLGLKGWRLFMVADSERSWLEIAKGKRLWSSQNEVNGSDGENSFGQTQDLGSLSRVEWRLKADGTPIALIFQVQATDPNSTLHKLLILYRFYVIGLSKGVPQFCGSFKTKEEARKIVHNPSRCNDLQELSVTR